MKSIDQMLQEKIEKQRKQKSRRENKRLKLMADFIVESALYEHNAKQEENRRRI